VRAVAFGLAASLLIAFLIPKRYDSTIRLMPPDSQSSSALTMLSAMAGKGGLGIGAVPEGLLGLHSSGALFVDILGSRTVQDRIVDRFDLRKVYGERYQLDARKRLQDYTDVSEDRKSEVIAIRVRDRNPRRAAQMAQAYVDELDHLVAQVSTSSARRERVFIEGRLSSVKQELDRASREFSQFASQNATMDITSQGRAALEAAARLQGELIAAQSELQGLEQIYAANNVRVRTQQARVDEFQRQLDKLDGDRSRIAAGSVAGVGGDQPEEVAGSAFPSIRQIPLLGVRWEELYRQARMEETLYELLNQQYELAKIEEAKEIPTVKVLDAADVPEKKSFPPRAVIALMGTLLGLSGGVFYLLSVAAWARVDPQDSRKQLAEDFTRHSRVFFSHWVWRARELIGKAAE
jgi:capsule polysaccharide export protein KpsE/RkpR